MKKLAIITISWGQNYGNKLQNYAMQEVYKKLNFYVETIKFLPDVKRNEIKRKITLKKILKKIYNIVNHKKLILIQKNRNICFGDFNKKINFSAEYNERNYINIEQKYDFYSVGSDQVWNAFFPDYSDYYLIDFIKTKNKIAYSPSLGTNEIPPEKECFFKEALSKYKAISCREEAGAKVLENLLNKKVDVLIDPTMLLRSDEWEKVMKKPAGLADKKYVLCYFLGMKDKKNMNIIKKYAKKNRLAIVNLLDPNSDFYGTGPAEFLYLEKNAEVIFTDSFHSSVFSILFDKPFVITFCNSF